MADGSARGRGAVPKPAFEAALADGFEGDDFSPAGGLYYRRNAEQRAGFYEFQREVTRGSAGALKLGVRPAPVPGRHGSERAEVWERTALRVPYERAVWYGFSVRFGEPIPQADHRHLIAQWKREIGPSARGDYSPFLAFRLVRGRLFATVETTLHPADLATPDSPAATPAWLRRDADQMRALVATDDGWGDGDGSLFSARTGRIVVTDRGSRLPAPDSGWIDFAVMTRPGLDGSGQIELFANGRWVVTVRGDIGHDDAGLGTHQYFKFGPYRSAAAGEWTLYFDNFRRSMRAEDVLDPRALAAYRAAGAPDRPATA
ncbi:polysaccharide lyase (plasmid) [Rhizobium sp. TRM96647]|uniref:polysaccharide lyase n=1 Tax=unclassified Rhizobium TaxID=2613769 RepID=UPI0021E6ECF7|nr:MULTISPECIES: polysaccharide lyase [unclassified Rhizobium]MCV3735711.1 polysaccharide lyase [Rhizobium sp. TRM96647]MCV3757526.1 polysaccharide lyase [Rhizobium sp. TRM96650]